MGCNGWSQNAPPSVAHLEKTSHTSSYATKNSLIFKGSLELSHLTPHPFTEVIVQLEYVLSLHAKASSNVELLATPTFTIILVACWGVWLPYVEEGVVREEEETVNIELKRGPGYTPHTLPCSAHDHCYQVYHYSVYILHCTIVLYCITVLYCTTVNCVVYYY